MSEDLKATSSTGRGSGGSELLSETDLSIIREELRRHNISFEGRHLPISRQLYLVSAELDRSIRTTLQRLHAVVEKVLDAYRREPRIREYLRIPEHMHRPITDSYEPGLQNFYCRCDFSFDARGRPQVYEINADCPAGIARSRRIYDALCKTNACRDLVARGVHSTAFPHQTGSPLVDGLLARLSTPGPVIAVLNSRFHTLWNEVELIVEDFRERGHRSIHAYVEDLEYDGRRLSHQGIEIDACYCKFDNVTEFREVSFSESREQVRPFLNAARDRQVVMLNRFVGMYVAEHKGLLALVHDESFADLFDDDELELIRGIVPETHMLSADNAGRILRDRSRWVVKGCLDTRGRSVHIGASLPPDRWQAAIAGALRDGAQPHVAQRYVSHERSAEQFLSQAYFLVDGKPAGWFSRISRDIVTNVGNGGALQIPVLVGGEHA
jgi:hypothetical protein